MKVLAGLLVAVAAIIILAVAWLIGQMTGGFSISFPIAVIIILLLILVSRGERISDDW